MNPRDEVTTSQLKKIYKKIKTIQTKRPETKRAVIKRKAELDAWAIQKVLTQNKKMFEEPVQIADLKRVGADVKKVYMHKDGKTELVVRSKKR